MPKPASLTLVRDAPAVVWVDDDLGGPTTFDLGDGEILVAAFDSEPDAASSNSGDLPKSIG